MENANILKWILLSTVGLVLLMFLISFCLGTYYNLVANPKISEELRTAPQGERALKVMLLTLPNGREIPVNYLREEGKVFVGSDGLWWRLFRNSGSKVSMLIKGQKLSGSATLIENDPEYVRSVFSRLRPDVPKWLPDALNAHLIEIKITTSR